MSRPTQFSAKVQDQLTRKAVLDATTTDTPSPASRQQLLKILNNSDTVDSGYEKIMERAVKDRNTQRVIFSRCIALLKNSLTTYVPSSKVLLQLDEFCIQALTLQPPPSAALVKSISFNRALISRHLRERGDDVMKATPTAAHQPTPTAATQPNARAQTRPAQATQQEPRSGEAGDGVMHCHVPAELWEKDTLIDNFLVLRQPPPTFAMQAPASTLRHWVVFSGQFNRLVDGDENGKICGGLDVKDSVCVPDLRGLEQQITTVTVAKQLENETNIPRPKSNGSGRSSSFTATGTLKAGQSIRQRKSIVLFQYKPYSAQLPLVLSEEELGLVISTIVDPCLSPESQQSRLIATKILCKLFVDMYNHEPVENWHCMLPLLLEMLASAHQDTRCHAFNLLFNLSIHVCLNEDHSVHSAAPAAAEETAASVRMHADLYHKLSEMLLWLLHKEESDEKVWAVSLSCFLHFVTDGFGHLIRSLVLKMDIRVIMAFLRVLPADEHEVQCQLLKIVVHYLYETPTTPASEVSAPTQPLQLRLSLSRLASIGGITQIIRYYVSALSVSARQNLYVVIFDYLVLSIPNERTAAPDAEQVSFLFEVLKKFEGAETFVSVFKYLPPNFVERFVKFVFFDQLRRDTVMSESPSKLDKNVVVAFMYRLEALARQFTEVHAEFLPRVQGMLGPGGGGDEDTTALDTLIALLFSKNEWLRANGEAWVIHLVKGEIHDSRNEHAVKVWADVNLLIKKLLHSDNPAVRRLYMSLTEKTVLHYTCRMQTHGDPKVVAEMARLLNNRLMQVVLTQEQDDSNLLYIFHFLLSFMSIRNPSAGDSVSRTGDLETEVQMFLAGKLFVPGYFLQHLSVAIFAYLFWQFDARCYSAQREVLIILIFDKCRDPAVFAAVGGVRFCKDALDDRDPRIAYHASKFLLSHVIHEQPQDYRQKLNRLIGRAQSTNNEKLLENAYLQIRALLDDQ